MGGELEKASMQQKTSSKNEGKTTSRNHKTKLQAIKTNSPTKKSNMKTAIKTNVTNNEGKREKGKKKKERVSVVSLDVDEKNHEKKSIRINPRKKRRKRRL